MNRNTKHKRLKPTVPSKPSEPGQERITTKGPQDAPDNKDNSNDQEAPLMPDIPPTSLNTNPTRKPWYKRPFAKGAKAVLEIIAIPFAIGYTVITAVQLHDLRQNFAAEQRAWLKFEPPTLPMTDAEPINGIQLSISNVGKSA